MADSSRRQNIILLSIVCVIVVVMASGAGWVTYRRHMAKNDREILRSQLASESMMLSRIEAMLRTDESGAKVATQDVAGALAELEAESPESDLAIEQTNRDLQLMLERIERQRKSRQADIDARRASIAKIARHIAELDEMLN